MRIPTLIHHPERPRSLPTPHGGPTRLRAAVVLVVLAAAFGCHDNPFVEGELAPQLSIVLNEIDRSSNLQTVVDLADNIIVRVDLPDDEVVQDTFDFATDQQVIRASVTLPIQGDEAEVTVLVVFLKGSEPLSIIQDVVVVRRGETNEAELEVHPCAAPFLYTIGETVSGEASASDCEFHDDFRFEITEQLAVAVQHGQESSSHGFLYRTPALAGARADAIGFAGDGSTYLLAPGTYSLTVGYPGEGVTGPYEFALRPVSPDPEGCPFLYMTDGVRTSGTLDSDDCHANLHAIELDLAEPLPSESFFTWLEAGETVTATISMQGSQTQAAIFASRDSVLVHRQVGSEDLRLSHTAEVREYHQVAVIGEPGTTYSVAFETQ